MSYSTSLYTVAPSQAILRPGTIGLSKIEGITGWFVRLALMFSGDESRYEHVFIVGHNGMVIEARRGGVIMSPLSRHKAPKGFLFIPMTDEQGERIVAEAIKLIGTPYSYLDYVYLAAVRLGLPSKWLKQRVMDTGYLICSQMVDKACRAAGIILFDDGRIPQDITPGDIAALAIEYIWEKQPNGDLVSRLWRV
jgi:hypothetical protein